MTEKTPFDKEKSYFYSIVLDYHINKAIQLYNIKNFDLALKEFQGIKEYSIREDKKDILDICNKYIPKIKNILDIREDTRNKFLNNSNKIYFLNKSNELEEYHDLIEKIDLEEIKLFNPLNYIIEFGKNSKDTYLMFDLDSTLLDNSPRVYKIIQDFIKDYSLIYPNEIEKLKNLKRANITWGLKENLKSLGIESDEKFMKEIFQFWYDRFFSNEYIIDAPIKGSVDFVNKAKEKGFEIIYLTGRFESMRKGTLENLEGNNFPIKDKNKSLIMKPSEKIPDHSFKDTVMEEIKRYGNILASFDNEPINVNIFKKHLPESKVFFIETNHSLNPPNLDKDIHTISNFILK